MHLRWPHNAGEKGIRWESWAIRSLYLGSNASIIHCILVREGEAKQWTMSQETCLIAVRWKLPCKVWIPHTVRYSRWLHFHDEGGFFMECRKVRTWTYRIMHWLNGRWGVLLLLSCFTKFCFPATDKTAHPPQEQNNSWLKSGHFIRKQYFIFFIGLCIERYAVFLFHRKLRSMK